jgi:hypothetical protein
MLTLAAMSQPPAEHDSIVGSTCTVVLANRVTYVRTYAKYGDFGPVYVTSAWWEESPGEWLSVSGFARDSLGQVEQLMVVHSVRR